LGRVGRAVARGRPDARHPAPATAVFARRVKPGREHEYEGLAEEMVDTSKAFPGHLAVTMLHEANSLDYTLVYSFVDQPALQAWLDSPERQRLLARADQIAEQHDELPPLTGLETWFTLPHQVTIKPPPRWKMWLVSLVAVYPLVVCFQAWLAPALKAWPLLLRSAAFPLVLLTTMTYVVMPITTRLMRWWLYP
jgi:uncharacterized protein